MIEIRREDISIDEVVQKMKSPKIGAVLAYLGTVREFPSGNGLEFRDDSNAIHRLGEIRQRAIAQFDVEDVAIVHRIGFLSISESILMVAVSASHRWAAFDACLSIVGEIKALHESWKKAISK